LLSTEVGFEDRTNHQQHSHLGHPVPDRGNAKGPLATIALVDPYPKKGQRTIGLVPQLLLQLRQPWLHASGFNLIEGNPVYSRCTVVGTTMPVGIPEYISTTDLVPQAVKAIAGFGFGFRL